MITIEAYRARIGCFFSKHQSYMYRSQRSFRSKNHAQKSFSYLEFFQVCVMLLYIITLKMNINMAFLKLSLLLLGGDIESNPGPGPASISNRIQKVVSGNFHQGHSKFGNTAGIQCSCNALFAICFSIVKKVSLWKPFDLDYILENGDKAFKIVGITRALFMSELPHNMFIENYKIEVEMLQHFVELFKQENIFEGHDSITDTGNGLIFMTGGYTLSLIWSKNFVYLFDSHSRDQERI